MEEHLSAKNSQEKKKSIKNNNVSTLTASEQTSSVVCIGVGANEISATKTAKYEQNYAIYFSIKSKPFSEHNSNALNGDSAENLGHRTELLHIKIDAQATWAEYSPRSQNSC